MKGPGSGAKPLRVNSSQRKTPSSELSPAQNAAERTVSSAKPARVNSRQGTSSAKPLRVNSRRDPSSAKPARVNCLQRKTRSSELPDSSLDGILRWRQFTRCTFALEAPPAQFTRCTFALETVHSVHFCAGDSSLDGILRWRPRAHSSLDGVLRQAHQRRSVRQKHRRAEKLEPAGPVRALVLPNAARASVGDALLYLPFCDAFYGDDTGCEEDCAISRKVLDLNYGLSRTILSNDVAA